MRQEGFSGCVQCGRIKYYDETGRVCGVVSWTCCYCGEFVCRYCTLIDPAAGTYYDDTYCSEECREKKETEREIPKIMES